MEDESSEAREIGEAEWAVLWSDYKKVSAYYGWSSSHTELFAQVECVRIIDKGRASVKYLLKELRENGPDWFAVYALRKITGEDPVPVGHCGRLILMTEDWLTWAKSI